MSKDLSNEAPRISQAEIARRNEVTKLADSIDTRVQAVVDEIINTTMSGRTFVEQIARDKIVKKFFSDALSDTALLEQKEAARTALSGLSKRQQQNHLMNEKTKFAFVYPYVHEWSESLANRIDATDWASEVTKVVNRVNVIIEEQRKALRAMGLDHVLGKVDVETLKTAQEQVNKYELLSADDGKRILGMVRTVVNTIAKKLRAL